MKTLNVRAVVEIPQGSYYKYEQDKETGILMLDRVLLQPYPYNYGYVPKTLCEDGDALDVFIISDQPIHPLTMVKVNIVGVLKCTDNGEGDDKLLGTVVGDPFSEIGQSIIIKFLETYKSGFTVNAVGGLEDAYDVLHKSLGAYRNNNSE